MTLLAAVLLSACSTDETTETEEPLPDGMGRLRITVTTRAVLEDDQNHPVHEFPWETPDHLWEVMHSLRVIICKASDNKVVQIVSVNDEDIGNSTLLTSNPTYNTDYRYKDAHEVISQPLPVGNYHVFATANYNDGYTVGSTVDLDRTVKFTNGYSEANIPMTGKLTDTNGLKTVEVTNGAEINAGTLTVWRVIAKLQFEFTNESAEQIEILGIEVDPINQASADGPGIYLFSKDDLTSTNNLAAQNAVGTVSQTTATCTWPLHDNTQTGAIESTAGLFNQKLLSWGSKLEGSGQITAQNTDQTKLQKFKAKEKVSSPDDDAAITLTVNPRYGLTFTPTGLSFKACRGGTNSGKIDVVVISGGSTITAAQGITPNRYNVDPYLSEYSYNLSNLNCSPTKGDVVVKIYVYNLDKDKEYAFSDIVITGNVQTTDGVTLEGLTLPSGASTDVGTVTYTPSSAFTLDAKGGTKPTGSLFFYVNETDASFTTMQNQLSLRFKIKRGGTIQELRYGVTTHYDDGTTGSNGFNVIRRNDWIHIPVILTDWQFRVEPLAFVPIAGYPAATVSSDGLTTTFSTGGMIALQPFVKKYDENTWRAFGDPEINDISISWRSLSGSESLVTTPFIYDPVTKCIIGELNNNLAAGTYKTSVTVNVKLGPSGSQYDYSFTFNVVLQK